MELRTDDFLHFRHEVIDSAHGSSWIVRVNFGVNICALIDSGDLSEVLMALVEVRVEAVDYVHELVHQIILLLLSFIFGIKPFLEVYLHLLNVLALFHIEFRRLIPKCKFSSLFPTGTHCHGRWTFLFHRLRIVDFWSDWSLESMFGIWIQGRYLVHSLRWVRRVSIGWALVASWHGRVTDLNLALVHLLHQFWLWGVDHC